MRTVADIMNPKLLYIRDGERLSLARAQILRFGVTAVPVLDETHRPVGIVSLRDLSAPDEQLQPRPALTVVASASVEEGARRLATTDAHQLVVVGSDGVAVGMVSAVDFLREMLGVPPRHPPPFARV